MSQVFAEIAGVPSLYDRMERVQAAINRTVADPRGGWCGVADLTETNGIE